MKKKLTARFFLSLLSKLFWILISDSSHWPFFRESIRSQILIGAPFAPSFFLPQFKTSTKTENLNFIISWELSLSYMFWFTSQSHSAVGVRFAIIFAIHSLFEFEASFGRFKTERFCFKQSFCPIFIFRLTRRDH